MMMPSKQRKEWAQLVSGEITPKFSSLALQIALSRVTLAYKFNRISMQDAVDEIYKVSEKYYSQVEKDLQAIFR